MSLEFVDPCCPLKWYVDLWCATLVDKVVDFQKEKSIYEQFSEVRFFPNTR